MEPNFEDNDLLARWLNNKLTKEEENELAKDKELDALKVVIEDIDTWQLKKLDVEAGLKNLHNRKNNLNEETNTIPLKKKNNLYWIGGIAASFALLIASYFLYNNFINTNITVSTSVAENKTINLPSGSKVYLDALSSITYNKKDWKSERSIKLNGQALFKVTKDKTFKVITTNNASVTVLGTIFNINTNNNELAVACYEGKVAVEFKNEKEVLTEGQGVFLDHQKLIRESHQNSKPNWQQGFSKYQQTSLVSIVTDLKKYYTIDIDLPKKYDNLKFSGIMPHDNLEMALKTLFTPFEIEYQIKNETVIFK